MLRIRVPAMTLGAAIAASPAILGAQPAANPEQAASATRVNDTSSNMDSTWTQPPESQPPTAPTARQAPQTTLPTTSSVQSTPLMPSAPWSTTPEAPPPTAPEEPPTLFNGRSVKIGGYGGIGVRYARLGGEDGVLAGVEGALLLDHRLAIGLAGYTWANQNRVATAGNLVSPYLHYGYGGMLVRYHVYFSDSPVYLSGGALLGGGVVGLTSTWDGDLYRENSDIFFVCEPQIGIHVNFTRWMRASANVGYRIHSGVGKFGYTESDFNGIGLGGNLEFGWF